MHQKRISSFSFRNILSIKVFLISYRMFIMIGRSALILYCSTDMNKKILVLFLCLATTLALVNIATEINVEVTSDQKNNAPIISHAAYTMR